MKRFGEQCDVPEGRPHFLADGRPTSMGRAEPTVASLPLAVAWSERCRRGHASNLAPVDGFGAASR